MVFLAKPPSWFLAKPLRRKGGFLGKTQNFSRKVVSRKAAKAQRWFFGQDAKFFSQCCFSQGR
jgi:hypothetical protein